MKATEQYVPVMQFVILSMVVLTFESAGEILKSTHSSEIDWAVLSYVVLYSAVQGGSNFQPVDEILRRQHSNESY